MSVLLAACGSADDIDAANTGEGNKNAEQLKTSSIDAVRFLSGGKLYALPIVWSLSYNKDKKERTDFAVDLPRLYDEERSGRK